MPHDPQLQIASCLLSGHINDAARLSPAERLEVIDLALELAADMISRRNSGLPKLEHAPPSSSTPQAGTKSRLVERELRPLGELLANRRKAAKEREPNAAPAGKPPTLH